MKHVKTHRGCDTEQKPEVEEIEGRIRIPFG